MAITNPERVGRGLELLKQGLAPFVGRELKARYGDNWLTEVRAIIRDRRIGNAQDPLGDVAVLLLVMDKAWGAVFGNILAKSDRTIAIELVDIRNRWAHQESFSGDDTYRALDSCGRLLIAISAQEADEVNRLKTELLRTQFEERSRSERRKAQRELLESPAASTLKPWRDVVTPHPDVSGGTYQQAEFAADLWQVHLGEGTPEYRDSVEFFRRTYLTESLRKLLVDAMRRLDGRGGDPVVQLQTNFGGGKTHSMLALYHLAAGGNAAELPGVSELLAEAELAKLPSARRVVLVGNKISPGNPSTKPDGTVVRTLWGELAWQLGGKKAFARIAEDDRNATNPGDVLRELMVEYGPCLILIDEWVAYARQLHDQGDLPGGTFETQFTFAQALTESARLANNCLLVISLPASDTGTSPHTVVDDVEVGGVRGREALHRLGNVIGRLESSWRPASAEEGFEIVRRRLFQPMSDPEQFTQRDVTARAFAELYRNQKAEFPTECAEAAYEARIKAAYPIHPEIFDRLYTDWSTLVKFQRTRGVLRLMAAVIHSLWESGDRQPVILPASIPINDPRVQFELTRYLPDAWAPIIESDVDGPNALPPRLDAENANLGRFSATRRVARTVYMGSAPTKGAAHQGVDDRRVKLGCVFPGEQTAVFGDALRRLANAATYLFQDGSRYWYSTQATVTKIAEDRASQFARESDRLHAEIARRLQQKFGNRAEFARIHVLPSSPADVPDDLETRLVVLDLADAYSNKDGGSAAELKAAEILESRGTAPRLFRNTLVFLAADRSRVQDLEDGAKRYLAWRSIVEDSDKLNLDPNQKRQAESRLRDAESTLDNRIPEAYIWVLSPRQEKPSSPITFEPVKVGGQEGLAARVSKKLRNEEQLISNMAGTILQMHLNRVPLWRGDHVAVRQLVEDFAKYPYLPRVAGPDVIVRAIQDGVASTTWASDGFGFADAYDEAAGRYRGLKGGVQLNVIDADSQGLVVKPDVAEAQREKDRAEKAGAPTTDSPGVVPTSGAPTNGGVGATEAGPPVQKRPTRFHGSVQLDPQRVASGATSIHQEIIQHLVGLVGSDVKVTLEIEASIPDGVPEHVVRTVSENARVLKFGYQEFQ
jgi:predicted AAA+ superfamily ATPase